LDDLAALMPAQPDGIWLGDTRGRADIEQLGSRLAVAEAELDLPDGGTRIVAAIESARGALLLPSVAEAGPRLAAIACDVAALARDIGCEPGSASQLPEPLRAVRASTVLTAAACRVPAIEAGAAETVDPDAYAAEAVQARRDGFSAKLACDPDQLAVLGRLGGQPPFGRWIENFVSGVATK
jgi:citrate lyase subunit beta/citryl-CoA lyase